MAAKDKSKNDRESSINVIKRPSQESKEPSGSGAKTLPFCSPFRAIFVFLFYFFPCIYLDLVASNFATVRWNLLSDEQKRNVPDITHDKFPYYENHRLLKEWPLVILYCIAVFGFFVPYDIVGISLEHRRLGKPLTTGINAGASYVKYRRGEAWVRYFETRCILELMRASSVWVTTISDPHGIHCMDIETYEIENIWTTNTFARCGDNIYSGHASHLLSLAVVIQSYFFTQPAIGGGVGSMRYWILTGILWSLIVLMSFYVVVSRLHYSVDVMLAWFLVPMVWLSWNTVSGPSVFEEVEEKKKRT